MVFVPVHRSHLSLIFAPHRLEPTIIKPPPGLRSNGRLLALHASIRLVGKLLTATNTPAYYGTEEIVIMVVKVL